MALKVSNKNRKKTVDQHVGQRTTTVALDKSDKDIDLLKKILIGIGIFLAILVVI